MSRTLQDFLTAVQDKGVRKTNQWQLEISSGYSDVDNALSDVTVWATTTEVPSRTQEYIELPYQGYPLQVAGMFTMSNETTLTVRTDASGDIRKAFLKWMSYVTNPAIGEGSNLGGDKRIPAGSYVRMKMLGEDMETVVETYKHVGCGVQEVGIMSMSNEGVEIATFDVIIKSQYWELEDNKGEFQDLI
jgi:hypothetical protein